MAEKNELKEWYETLPNGRVKELKAEIIRVCLINDNIFKNWLSGKTTVPPLAYDKLNKIAIRESKKPIYNESPAIVEN